MPQAAMSASAIGRLRTTASAAPNRPCVEGEQPIEHRFPRPTLDALRGHESSEIDELNREVGQAYELIEGVRGRIPDIARMKIAKGKVRENALEILRLDFPNATKEWIEDSLKFQGWLHPKTGVLYIRGGSGEQMAGTLIHEAVHRLQATAEHPLLSFAAEVQAHLAERDFYILTYLEPGGQLYGKTPATSHIEAIMKASDGEIMSMVEEGYSKAGSLAKYLQPAGTVNVDEIVEDIFTQIAETYGSHDL